MKTRMLYNLILVLGFVTFAAAMIFAVTVRKQEQLQEPLQPVNRLSQDHAQSIIEVINAQGFDDAFTHYSSYKDIPDPRFHELRQNYIRAATELKDYLSEAAGKTQDSPYYLKKYGL